MDDALLIRADASAQIGTGHVMRCLALAQAWQETGGYSTFAIVAMAPALEDRLKSEGMAVLHLAVGPGSSEDAAQTVSLAQQSRAAWVVVDGYHFGAAYQCALKAAGLRVLSIDDYGHAGHYAADLVLNQNIYADESLYLSREPYTRLLLGTRYVLLRREFWPWRGWQREIPEIARKVLVTLGGSDPNNATLKVIQALWQVSVEGLEAVVVVGGSNPHFETLQSAICYSRFTIRLESNVTNMPELMAWADIAISAGGSTCWELVFMGLPAIILVLAENQRPVARGLEAAGAAINLGWHTDLTFTDIGQALNQMLVAPDRRAAIARRGQELVDAIGPARVVRQMEGHELTLRPVQASDSRLIWEWANDPTTRALSFSSEPIPWEQHVAWFTARLADHQCRFYIVLDANAVPVGQIRYQMEGEDAIVSVNLAPDQRGRGYGSQVIRLGSQIVFASTAVNLIHAYVKPDNLASIRAFTKAGFANKGTVEVQGIQALHFVLRKDARL